MPVVLLFVLFVVVPLAELYVIIQVGDWLGVLPTIGILLLDSILGSMLMRSQGRAVWRRFTEAVNSGRPPAREVLDGALVLLGGAFLLAPGFITDVVGLLLLLPPTRAALRRLAFRRLLPRMVVSFGPGPTTRRPFGGRPADVEGTATDVDPEPRRSIDR